MHLQFQEYLFIWYEADNVFVHIESEVMTVSLLYNLMQELKRYIELLRWST